MANVQVIAAQSTAAAGGSFQGPYSGVVNAASDGTLTIDSRDLAAAMGQGWVPVYKDVRHARIPAAALANVNLFFSSAALANGVLAVAAQPDVPRSGQAIVINGTAPITAGTLTEVYIASDGTTQTDVISLVTGASAAITPQFSKGVLHVTSQTVAGLTGGTTPTIQIGTNATLAVPMPLGTVDAAILKEGLDGADVSTAGTLGNTGLYKPNTAPNATHNYDLDYSLIVPA